MISVCLYDAPGGKLLADYTIRLRACSFSTNTRGDAEATLTVPAGLQEAFGWFNDAPSHLEITFQGKPIYAGRVVGVAMEDAGVTFTAVGYSTVFSDAPYTALWSKAGVDGWTAITANNATGFNPALYNIDTNNRLFIGTKRGATYGAGVDIGGLSYSIPFGSLRQIVGCQFSYTFNAPTNWSFYIYGYTIDSSGGLSAGASLLAVTSGGGALSSAALLSFSGYTTIACFLYNGTGASSTPAGEDGANYLQITDLRVVTSTANLTTMTATSLGSGSGAHALWGGLAAYDTHKTHIGQALVATRPGFYAETQVVEVVNDYHMIAVVNGVHSYVVGNTLVGHRTTSSEVVKDILATVGALNGDLSLDTSGIQESLLDLTDARYEDVDAAALLDTLADLGDSPVQYRWGGFGYPPTWDQIAPYAGDLNSRWYWRVGPDRRLVFDRIAPGAGNGGTGYFTGRDWSARAWHVDLSTLSLERTLETLANSDYATYQDASGLTLRTATSTDSSSVNRYGLTKQVMIPAQTTSVGVATRYRDTSLLDTKTPAPRAGLSVARIYTAQGAEAFLWQVRAGDTITIRNLPATLGSAADQVRTFSVARTTYDVPTNTISIEPATPLPQLAFILAQQALRT